LLIIFVNKKLEKPKIYNLMSEVKT